MVSLLVPILEDRIATLKEEINGCNQELQSTLEVVLEKKVKSDVKAEQDPSTAWLLSETSVDYLVEVTKESEAKIQPIAETNNDKSTNTDNPELKHVHVGTSTNINQMCPEMIDELKENFVSAKWT